MNIFCTQMLILLVLLISVQHAYSVSTCNRRNGQLPEHGMFWEDYIGEWTYLNTPSQSYASMEGYYITSAMEDKCADRCKNPPSLVDESFGGPVGWIYEEYNGGSRDYFAFAVEILVDSSGYYTSWKYYPICKCVHRDALNAISSSPDYSDYTNEPSNFIHSFYRWAYGFEVPHSPITCSAPIMHHIKDDNGDCPCYPGTYAPSCNIWTVCGSHEYEAVSPTSQRNRVCELKVCICPTGAATTGDQCPTHNTQRCLTDLIPWEFYEFKDNTYLSTTQDDIISFDLAPLYQSKEYQRQATVDVDNIQGEYTYYEISFDEPVSYNELTDKCSGFCGASELDMSEYYIKSSGYCTDDGHYIDTIEECKDAFSSTGTIVDEVNKFKISTFGRGKYCHDNDFRSARTFTGTCDNCIAEATEGSTSVDYSPSVRYNCYLSCLENYQNKDGTPFVVDDQVQEDIKFFDEDISRSFYVRDTGRCYCLSHDTDHCNRNDIDLVSWSTYENYDIPTVPFCTIKDGDVFYKTPYTDMQRERECGEDGFNCLCRRKAEMKNILTPEKSRDPALHATFVGNGYCAGEVVNEMGVNCPDGELVEVDGVNKCQKPRNRLLGLDWKYTTDNGASRGHPIGQEECEQECVRRGCTAYSVSVALNKCRFSYDECTSLQGSEPDEIQVSEFSISGTEYIFPEVVHFKRFTMDVANEQDTDISVKVWDDEFYGCTTECIGNCNNPSYTFIPDGSYSVVAPVQEPPFEYDESTYLHEHRKYNKGGFIFQYDRFLTDSGWSIELKSWGYYLRCWQNFRDENIYIEGQSGQYGTIGGYPIESLSDCMNACQGSSEFFYRSSGVNTCLCRNEPYTCSIDNSVNYPYTGSTLGWREIRGQRHVLQPGIWESDTCQSCPGGLSWNMAMTADPMVTHNEVKEVICPVAGSSVRFGSSYTNIAIYRHPTWKTYKMDRNIVKVGNYTGELRLMETIWDEETPKCRCYASENELPIKVQETSSLFTVYTGEFVPTWDKSLFYKREHKNPFVCNYESYSEYGGITSDSCGCGDDIALAEMETTFSIGSRRSITYGGSDIPGDTLSDKLQYCAKSCRDKIFISRTVTDELPVLVRTGQCDSGYDSGTPGLSLEGCALHCMSNPNHKGFIFGSISNTNCYCSTTNPKTCDRSDNDWNNYYIPLELRGSIHHNPEWLINNDADIITMMTTGPKSGECVCSSQSDVNSESATLNIEGYKSFKLRPGCSCAGTFILNHEKVMCPTGSFNAGSCQYDCPQCPRGYYQSEEGRISCDKCPEGYFQDSVGKDSCKTCTNFCSEGGPKGSGTSSTCPPASIADTTSCSQCTGERHFIQQKSIFLTQGMKHAHGVYSPKLVYVDPGEVCINCPLGWFDSNNECTACPRGYYGRRGTTVCNACQAGTYQSKEGQTQCTNCDDGKYQPDEAQTTCMECPIGKAREAYFPHNSNIMKKQGLTQDCLTCGSTYPSLIKPGCIYCNQYQDEVGQKRCKRCPMNPNAQWQIYSYIDQNNNPYTKEGSCKYAENLNYWWERRRVVDPRPDGMRWGELEWCGEEYTDQPFSSQEEKKQFQNWTACVYASNTWTGMRYENHVLLEYEDWFGDYNFYKDAYTLQGYDKKCTREGYSDFYINNFLDLECNTTVAQLQYAAYGSEVPI